MHPETLDRICNSLLRGPYAVVDNFLSEETLFGIVEYMDNLFGQGEFHQAQIGKGLEKQKATEIRSDKVFWIPKDIDNLAVGEYLKEMESLREGLAQFFRIHLARFESHLALYPVGSFYLRHLDQFREHTNRIFSCILYLNKNWLPSDGGALRMYESNGQTVDIFPEFGRFVCFRSDVVEHEVLPTQRERYSVTGWMRRDELLPINLA